MNNTAQASNVTNISVHRFGLPDINESGSWLTTRLRAKYPHLTDRGITSWFRGIMESAEYLFIRRNRGVMLAQIVKDPLSINPIVREIFCLAQEGGVEEAATLYDDLRRWAESLGAVEIIVESFSDVPKTQIAEALGVRVVGRSISVARLGP